LHILKYRPFLYFHECAPISWMNKSGAMKCMFLLIFQFSPFCQYHIFFSNILHFSQLFRYFLSSVIPLTFIICVLLPTNLLIISLISFPLKILTSYCKPDLHPSFSFFGLTWRRSRHTPFFVAEVWRSAINITSTYSTVHNQIVADILKFWPV
jgi:hypothetical protein